MMLAPGRDRTRRGNDASMDRQNNGAASRYEVIERAGQGTLWICYRARERTTGHPVLLKALKGAFNRHPRFVDSLFETGESLLSLSHPNLAVLHELGTEEGTLYAATEWLGGGSLETRLHKAPLTRAECLPALKAIAAGLGFLHQNGLIHGDLRPRQILADDQGQWKITDVGAARAFAAAGMATADAQPEAACYLAPERTTGSGPSPAGDIYSLGVILYRMLTGRVPFDGPSPLAVALRHRNDDPLAPEQLNPRADPALSNLALRLLSKQPEARPTAAEVWRELSGSAAGDPAAGSVVSPPPVPRPAPRPAASAGGDSAAVPTPAPAPRRRTDPVTPPAPDPPLDLATLRRHHKWREFRGMMWALVFLAGMLCVFGGMFIFAYRYWVHDTPPELHVPNYLNMSQDEATEILQGKGLTMRVGREVFDPKKAAGTVVSGDPPPGKVIRAPREVIVTISQGEQPITMFDFEGITLTQARKIILQHGMRLGQIVEEYHNTEPKDYICGQYPEAGQSFRRREPITLTVSRGPQPKDIDVNQDPLAGVQAPGENAQPTEPQFSTDPIDPMATPEATVAGGQSTQVSRAAKFTVAVPSDGPSQQVRIVVRDDNGERTVYSRRRKPGEVVARIVRVKRAQDSKALVRVYVGDNLVKEQSL